LIDGWASHSLSLSLSLALFQEQFYSPQCHPWLPLLLECENPKGEPEKAQKSSQPKILTAIDGGQKIQENYKYFFEFPPHLTYFSFIIYPHISHARYIDNNNIFITHILIRMNRFFFFYFPFLIFSLLHFLHINFPTNHIGIHLRFYTAMIIKSHLSKY